MTKPNINIPTEFAINGTKTDFSQEKITDGFDRLQPDVLPGDNLNKFIDDTYKGLNGVLELFEGCVLYDSTVIYNNKSIVFYINSDDKVEVYRSLINNNLNNPLDNDTAWEKVELGGTPRNIGEIVTSSIPLTDAGLHLLDGALIQGSGAYSAFVDYIKDLYNSGTATSCFTTEANWQSAVSTYGVCDKFVYDSVNNTVRLPKWGNQAITKSVSTASTVPVVGNGMSLGLTNGNSNFGLAGQYSSVGTAAFTNFYGTNIGTGNPSGTPSVNLSAGVTSDPTKSGLVANTSSLLTQYPLSCYYYIVIATSAKTDIQVDIDQIATDVNGKADKNLTNVSGTDVKNAIVRSNVPIITEVYINGTSGHIVYSNKLCEQWGVSNGSGNRTITLTKAYADMNYNLVGSSDSLSNTYDSSSKIVTASTFTIYTQVACNYYWRTIGIIS